MHQPDFIFHAMSRGNNRMPVFIDDQDHRVFLRILESVRERNGFRLLAYCLMPNHFHLLIEVGRCRLSVGVQQLLTRYACYFNRKHARIGHVFQGRFKSVLCKRDAQLIHLLKYIHLNPVKAALAQAPGDWAWSSHRDYLGDRSICRVDCRWPLSLLADDPIRARNAYRDFMGIDAAFDTTPSPEARSEEAPGADPEISLDQIAIDVAGETGIPLAQIRSPTKCRSASAARRLLALRGVQAGFRPTEVARFLGRSPSLVSRLAEFGGYEIANRKV